MDTVSSPSAPLASVVDAAVLFTLSLGQLTVLLVILIRDRLRVSAVDRKTSHEHTNLENCRTGRAARRPRHHRRR